MEYNKKILGQYILSNCILNIDFGTIHDLIVNYYYIYSFMLKFKDDIMRNFFLMILRL